MQTDLPYAPTMPHLNEFSIYPTLQAALRVGSTACQNSILMTLTEQVLNPTPQMLSHA